MNIYEELHWRGLIADCTDATELPKRLSTGTLSLYCGFDPTADSLHVGNLVPLLALRRFQIHGHHPIAVAGGATGSIGDPSGKTTERQLLTREVLDHNIACVKEQLAKLLEFDTTKTPNNNPARLVDNASWTANVSFLDFLRDIGKHFSVNMMVAKESVRARMEDREVGISYTEFSYMLLQAFDFYILRRDYNCELQIGGSDQWGNITAGTDLIRKKLSQHAFGLTLPLITNADGSKFGKTEAGAIWLDPKRTRKEDFYQFWIRTDDRDVIRYLKFFTFLSREEIEDLERQHLAKPESRVAHKALAQAVTNLVHSVVTITGTTIQTTSPAGVAEQVSKILYGTRFSDYTETDWELLAEHWRSVDVEKTRLEGDGMPLVELLVKAGLSRSKNEARRLIEGRGIRLNSGPPLPNCFYAVRIQDLQLGKYLLLCKGRRDYVVVTVK